MYSALQNLRSKEETSKSGSLWSKDEDETLKNLIQTSSMSISELALQFKRSEGGILCRIMGYAYNERELMSLDELSLKYLIEVDELKRFFNKRDNKTKKMSNNTKKRKISSISSNNDSSKLSTGLTPVFSSIMAIDSIEDKLDLNETNEHYIYCLIEREFIKTRESIYKVGKSNHIFKRMNSYPKGSRVIALFRVQNCHKTEKELLAALDNNPKTIRAVEIGREYYKGDLVDLMAVFTEVCVKNI
jgi:hypothetical protein